MAIWVWMDETLFRRHAERLGFTDAQIRDGWAKLTSDPNIEKARIQGRTTTMVKLWWIGLFNYWVQRRPVLQ